MENKKEKFKNIKVGETVFIREYIDWGWQGRKYFFIPYSVERETKSHFVANKKRVRKDNGKIIGEYYNFAYYEGEEYDKNISVKDESESKDKFKRLFNMCDKINNFKIGLLSPDYMKIKECEEILQLLKKVESIIKNREKKPYYLYR